MLRGASDPGRCLVRVARSAVVFACNPPCRHTGPRRPPTGLETMAGVQLLTAQGQALETGQHLPEEARWSGPVFVDT